MIDQEAILEGDALIHPERRAMMEERLIEIFKKGGEDASQALAGAQLRLAEAVNERDNCSCGILECSPDEYKRRRQTYGKALHSPQCAIGALERDFA